MISVNSIEHNLFKLFSSKIGTILLALGLYSSLLPFVRYGNYIAVGVMAVIALFNRFDRLNIPILCFWSWAVLCSVINLVYGIRDVAWTILLFSTMPLLGATTLSVMVLKKMFHLLPLFVLLNLLAYLLDINYFYILYHEPNKFCFSGLTWHPQWLGAMTGLACVYTYYYALVRKSGRKYHGIVSIAFFLMSVELALLAGSRSALMSAGASIFLMTFFTCENITDFLRKIGIIIILFILLYPIFLQSIEMIEVKQIAQSYIGLSRSHLWMQQLLLIRDNPFFGIGLVGGESGNGWLAVAAQTGLLGFVLILNIAYCCYRKIRIHISENRDVLFLSCILLYLIIHGCFEGYILTPGYIMCWIFWACVGGILKINE